MHHLKAIYRKSILLWKKLTIGCQKISFPPCVVLAGYIKDYYLKTQQIGTGKNGELLRNRRCLSAVSNQFSLRNKIASFQNSINRGV